MSLINQLHPIFLRQLDAAAVDPNGIPIQSRVRQVGIDPQSAILAVAIIAGILAPIILLIALDWVTQSKLSRAVGRLGGLLGERASRAWLRIRHPAAAKALEASSRAEAGQGPPLSETAQTRAGPGAAGAPDKFVDIPLGDETAPTLSRQEMRRAQVKNNLKKSRKTNVEKGAGNGSF